jgi:5-methylthioribose kinase
MTNFEMCALTEKVIFTEPYIEAPNNRWTSPQLDEDKKAIESDLELKICAAKYKTKFVTSTEALIHGDLHSGSVMCCPADHQTFVIDPEFAFYGPMGFDTGAFVANLFLSYVSQDGHSNGETYAQWVLEQIKIFWTTFETEFVKLWNDETEHTGMMFPRSTLGAEGTVAAQDDFMKGLLHDTLGFAGMKMLRRIVGIAHVEDLESIQDADVRAKCERRGLEIAKTFIKNSSSFNSIDEAIALAKSKAA